MAAQEFHVQEQSRRDQLIAIASSAFFLAVIAGALWMRPQYRTPLVCAIAAGLQSAPAHAGAATSGSNAIAIARAPTIVEVTMASHSPRFVSGPGQTFAWFVTRRISRSNPVIWSAVNSRLVIALANLSSPI